MDHAAHPTFMLLETICFFAFLVLFLHRVYGKNKQKCIEFTCSSKKITNFAFQNVCNLKKLCVKMY